MTTATTIVLPGPDAPEATLRSLALGRFLHRLAALDAGPARLLTAVDRADCVAAVAGAALVTWDDGTVRYVPGRAARERVAAGEDGEWPSAVTSRHRKLVHRSQGALFRFPVDAGSAPREGDLPADRVEAFVTDWTGLPGACALAVHPAHPLSTGLDGGATSAFTGWFCRHPLTGDLLPVWTATWVKPEFGTGAVLVNPAHSAVDLGFARQVGLPVRFALAPTADRSPAGWPTPPVLRTGQAVRSGPLTDGLPAAEVRGAYLDAVRQHGLAEKHEDVGLGSFVIGTDDAAGVELAHDAACRTVAAPGTDAPARRVAVSPAAAVATLGPDDRLTVVVPSTRVETDLLALRLLLAEPALGRTGATPTVVVVGQTLPVKDAAAEDVVQLAMLVSAAPLDSLTLKTQHLEPCERFLKAHESLPEGAADPADEVSGEVAKAAAQVKGLLLRTDTKQAFTHLYRLQKSLAKAESPRPADVRVYRVLAHAVAGTPAPQDAAAVWAAV